MIYIGADERQQDLSVVEDGLGLRCGGVGQGPVGWNTHLAVLFLNRPVRLAACYMSASKSGCWEGCMGFKDGVTFLHGDSGTAPRVCGLVPWASAS